MASLLLVACILTAAVLLVAAVVLAARRQRRLSGLAGMILAISVLCYSTALVAVSVATPAHDLAIGEWKCFDEWCVTITSTHRTGDLVQVELSVQNRGRREQAPDTPRAWLLHNGLRDPIEVPDLTSRIPGGSTRRIALTPMTVPAQEHPQLLITEGGLPSFLVIGDDNSPFHPQPAWLLG